MILRSKYPAKVCFSVISLRALGWNFRSLFIRLVVCLLLQHRHLEGDARGRESGSHKVHHFSEKAVYKGC